MALSIGVIKSVPQRHLAGESTSSPIFQHKIYHNFRTVRVTEKMLTEHKQETAAALPICDIKTVPWRPLAGEPTSGLIFQHAKSTITFER
jgi:hypothetical protein